MNSELNKPIHPSPVSANRRAGDDSGYRNIHTSFLDNEDPDPLEVVPSKMSYPAYARGPLRGICLEYKGGLPKALPVNLLRAPALKAVREADALVRQSTGCSILVLDGFRPAHVQAALWSYIRNQIMKKKHLRGRLPLKTEIEIGILADNIGSYCKIQESNLFKSSAATLVHDPKHGPDLEAVAVKHSFTPYDAACLYLTFMANKDGKFQLDWNAPTAHGSGGAADLWLLLPDGTPANLGVPFDYASPAGTDSPAEMDYFEREGAADRYRNAVKEDPVLSQYLKEIGINEVNEEVFRDIQTNRRILFNAMMSVGATHYFAESWHFNFGNERGGRQSGISNLKGSGNACHAILKGRDLAVWGNEAAHRLARRMSVG
jgi:D-alanyl-D-alanine dipeptidase